MLLYLLAAIADEPAATVPPALPASAQATPHFYLKPPALCDQSQDSGEIVVCAERDADKRYRLQNLDGRKYADAPVRAQAHMGADTLGVGGKQASVGGFPSNRVMVTFTVPF